MVQQTNPAEPGPPRSSASSGREVGQNQGAASSGQATAEAERTPAAPEGKSGWRHFGPTATTQAPSSGSATKKAGSAGQDLRATPSAKAAGREEDLSPGGAKPPAELIHKKEVQSAGKEQGTTELTKPEHGAAEPTRPGWHRFGDEGPKSHPKSQPRQEKSKPADSESDKKDQSKKTQH